MADLTSSSLVCGPQKGTDHVERVHFKTSAAVGNGTLPRKIWTRRKRFTLETLLPLYILVLSLLLSHNFGEALDLEKCRDALGMQTMEIPDSAIVASSSYDKGTVGPKNARIRTEKNGGAWCPKNVISKDTYEYLQINLGELYVITDVETQGRFGNGKGQEYTEAYVLEYQREDNGQWLRFRNRGGDEIFPGNQNTYRAELRGVSPPIIAKRIRFIPYSEHPRTVCMRVEMYGCKWEDGLLSYNMPQGHQRGTELDLYDYTYDGNIKNGYLSNGVGQLTDGLQGNSNFRMTDNKGLGVKGYDWVGWRNNSDMFKPIEIIFKFDGVRNFSEVFLYCNNAYKKYVRVFRTALISFSNGGKYYRDEIRFDYVKDTVVEYARDVLINLRYNFGRFVKMQIFFEARWILISEIRFVSVKLEGNYSDELPPPTTNTPTLPPGRGVANGNGENRVTLLVSEKPSPNIPNFNPQGTITHGGRQHKAPKVMDDSYVGIIIGALAALIIILFIVAVIIVVRHRQCKHNNNRPCQKPVVLGDRHVTINLSDLRGGCTNGKLSHGNMYNSVATDDMDSDRELCAGSADKLCSKSSGSGNYLEPKDSIQGRKLPDLPPTPDSSGKYSERSNTPTSCYYYTIMNTVNESADNSQ